MAKSRLISMPPPTGVARRHSTDPYPPQSPPPPPLCPPSAPPPPPRPPPSPPIPPTLPPGTWKLPEVSRFDTAFMFFLCFVNDRKPTWKLPEASRCRGAGGGEGGVGGGEGGGWGGGRGGAEGVGMETGGGEWRGGNRYMEWLHDCNGSCPTRPAMLNAPEGCTSAPSGSEKPSRSFMELMAMMAQTFLSKPNRRPCSETLTLPKSQPHV